MEDMISVLNSIPALFRLLMVFVLILLAIKRKWALGNTFLVAAIVLGFMFGMAPFALLASIVRALLDPKTLSLTVVVGLILILSHCLEKAGQMGRLLDGFKGMVRRPKINMVIFPALIGLLPMPGGAIFSAPMVKSLGRTQRLSDPQLNYINYWYRHIWEYWWPLYPGILLTSALSSIDLWHLVYMNLPCTAVVVLAGYWPLRGALQPSLTNHPRTRVGPFIRELLPILVAIAGGLSIGHVFSVILPMPMDTVAKELGLIAALAASIFLVWRANRMTGSDLRAIALRPELVKMMYMIAAILVFKGVLQDSGAVAMISREMLRWSIPLMPITMLLPFLVGMVSGITIAFVGATFPILISLVNSMGESAYLLPYLILAIISGFAGVLLSPLHLCLQMSSQYFKTGIGPVYRIMAVPIGALVVAGMCYFVVLRYGWA
jgi:integral membrane protein (TIGR00529 family)